MTPDAYLGSIVGEGEAFAVAAERGLACSVRACPGWSVGDLVYHLGEVHHFWHDIVAGLRTSVEGIIEPPRPPDDELVSWYRAGLARTVSVLEAADPAAACWTWAPQKNVAFVQRRMAQETAVHRWDAEDASGQAAPIDRELAVDGIDEFADFMCGEGSNDGAEPAGGTVHLHCTDGAGEWLFVPQGGGFAVTRGHLKGDAAVRGGASDLLLALWRRISPDRLDVIGDDGVAHRFFGWTGLD